MHLCVLCVQVIDKERADLLKRLESQELEIDSLKVENNRLQVVLQEGNVRETWKRKTCTSFSFIDEDLKFLLALLNLFSLSFSFKCCLICLCFWT